MAIGRSSVGQQITKPGVKRKKPRINYQELLKKYRSGKNVGATNLARLKARGLVARTGGKYKGKKKDLGNRGKS